MIQQSESLYNRRAHWVSLLLHFLDKELLTRPGGKHVTVTTDESSTLTSLLPAAQRSATASHTLRVAPTDGMDDGHLKTNLLSLSYEATLLFPIETWKSECDTCCSCCYNQRQQIPLDVWEDEPQGEPYLLHCLSRRNPQKSADDLNISQKIGGKWTNSAKSLRQWKRWKRNCVYAYISCNLVSHKHL